MSDDKNIKEILSLADTYALDCHIYAIGRTTTKDIKLQTKKKLQDEIVSVVAQYKEDAEKWREHVAQTKVDG